MKRRIILLLAACLLVISMAPAALALGPSDSGTCGDNLQWTLEDYVLTISGEGEMEEGEAPWEDYANKVERLVLEGGVTSVAAKAFYGFDSLESVEFGDALVEIGEKAFYGCDDLDYIHLPDTFRRFGAESFRDCESLKYVYCDGPMPSFKSSCLYTGNYIQVFCRTDNAWPADAVQQLVSNFGGRLGVTMGNFEDAILNAEVVEDEDDEDDEDAEETTEETVEETTGETVEETVEETTEATAAPTEVVEVAAEVVTEPATEPATEPQPTEAETEPPVVTAAMVEETTEETQAPEILEEEKPESKSWIGLVLIAGVLTFFIGGALIFKLASRRGGRYRG